jgi:hypothetical protein
MAICQILKKGDCGLIQLFAIIEGIRAIVEIVKMLIEIKRLNRKD